MITTTISHDKVTEVLKALSTKDFLALGLRDVAYVRAVKVEDRQAYAIHAADGTPLSVLGDRDSAIALILDNELKPATLH